MVEVGICLYTEGRMELDSLRFDIRISVTGNGNNMRSCTAWGPRGFGEKGYLFSGSWGALLNILGELGSKRIILGFKVALPNTKKKK